MTIPANQVKGLISRLQVRTERLQELAHTRKQAETPKLRDWATQEMTRENQASLDDILDFFRSLLA